MPARSVPEWLGKTPEAMPGIHVLLRLFERQNGFCACGCGLQMIMSRDDIDCDHILALRDGGENRESNLQLLLRKHHRVKTIAENVERGKERQHKAKAFPMLKAKKQAFPGSRASGYKKLMNGQVVKR